MPHLPGFGMPGNASKTLPGGKTAKGQGKSTERAAPAGRVDQGKRPSVHAAHVSRSEPRADARAAIRAA